MHLFNVSFSQRNTYTHSQKARKQAETPGTHLIEFMQALRTGTLADHAYDWMWRDPTAQRVNRETAPGRGGRLRWPQPAGCAAPLGHAKYAVGDTSGHRTRGTQFTSHRRCPLRRLPRPGAVLALNKMNRKVMAELQKAVQRRYSS